MSATVLASYQPEVFYVSELMLRLEGVTPEGGVALDCAKMQNSGYTTSIQLHQRTFGSGMLSLEEKQR